MAFRIAEYVVVALVMQRTVRDGFIESLIWTIIVAAIWITYFIRSTRVEETFIVPYPSYNYSYDPPPEKN